MSLKSSYSDKLLNYNQNISKVTTILLQIHQQHTVSTPIL